MIAAIIQARMNSTRLPGKVLKRVCGKPLLELLIERLKHSRYLDDLIIATTVSPADDPIEQLAKRLSIKYMRGSEEDVLGRYYQAAEQFEVDYIVRITGDCPLIDPVIVDRVIEAYMDWDRGLPRYDYMTNVLKSTFPEGLDLEIFSFEVLKRIHKLARKKYQREHVCTYVVENPGEFRIKNFANDRVLSDFRWTIDQPEDYKAIKAIYEGLYPRKKLFLMNDILNFLKKNPHVAQINKNIKKNEGFFKSLDKENLSVAEKNRIIDNVILKRMIHEVE